MKKIIAVILSLILAMGTFAVFAADDEISTKGWKATASSVNANGGVPCEKAEYVFDGNPKTHWQTMINPKAEPPHYITIEMPQITEIGGFRYYPRPDYGVGIALEYEIHVSDDGQNFKKVTEGKWGDDTETKTVKFSQNIKTKFVKLVINKGSFGFGSASEIRFLNPIAGNKTVSVSQLTGTVSAESTSAAATTTTAPATTTTTTATASGDLAELSTKGWKATASSVNANGGVPCEKAEYVFDGNPKTHWQTMINPKAEPPHYITIEMPQITEIGGFRYYPRPDYGVGIALEYEIHVSDDGTNFKKVTEGNWGDDTETKTVKFSQNIKTKFVKLVINKGSFGFGSASEIRVLGPVSGNKTVAVSQLTGTISTESTAGKVEEKPAATTTTPAATTPTTTTPAATPTTTPAEDTGDPKNVAVNPKGEGKGLTELSTKGWTAVASSVNANGGVPCEIPEYAFDGKLNTHWQTMINPKAKPPHTLTITLPSEQEFSGFRYYPRPDYGVGIVTDYEIHASNDGVNFYKLAEGTWGDNIETKNAEFLYNVKAKYVKLAVYKGSFEFASAAEIRLLSASSAKKTLALTEFPIGVVSGERIPMSELSKVAEDEVSVYGWTFDASSTNANNGVPCEVPELVVDGKLNTHWQTMINPKAPYPHHITVIMPEVTAISGYRYYPRADYGVGIVLDYEIHISEDGVNFTNVARGNWKDDVSTKELEFPVNIKVKAVKLVINKGSIGFGSAAEIRLLKEKEDRKTVTYSEYTANMGGFNLVEAQFEGMTVKATGKMGDPNVNMREVVTNMADGIISSYWQAQYDDKYIDIDYFFSYPYTLTGIRYVPKQSNTTGHFKKIEIYSSDDAMDYELFGTYTFDSCDKLTKTISFEENFCHKQMKIRVVDSEGNYASGAEIYFLTTEADYEKETALDLEKYILKIGSNEIKVEKGGVSKTVTMDVAPFIASGSTMIPLRGLLEEMGADINWVAYDQKIEVFSQIQDYMVFQIENNRVYINDVRYNSPVAPMIKDSRTFIPLRFVSENLGYKVSWNGATQEITITNK